MLSDCLEKKLDSLKTFLVITEAIRDSVEAHHIQRLEQLLRQRQEVVNTVDMIDDQIRRIRSSGPLKKQDEKTLSLFRGIEEILERSRALDQECTERMSLWREDVRDQLSKMREGLRAIHGYARRPIRPPKFLNVTQ